MKKLSTILLGAFMAAFGAVSAQCTIDGNNTTVGFTPTTPAAITQGTAYAQTVQVYAPSTYSVATIDSIHISSITGAPTGITYVINPASGTVNGGANGAICFSGTTNAATGSYPLTFNGTAYAKVSGQPTTFQLNAAPLNTVFTYTLTVQAAQQAPSCDTIFNVTSVDTPDVFTFGPLPNFGYLAGNNSYGDEAKAERFTGTVGNNVTGAYVFFSVVSINAADSAQTVAVNVYDATGAGNSPGNILATYNLPLSVIAAEVTAVGNTNQLIPVYVPFYSAPTLTATDFYVGVVLPTTTGDTVAIFSNSQTTANGRGWEQWSDGTWNDFDSVYTAGTPYHSGLYLAAIDCPPSPPVAQFGLASSAAVCAGSTVQFSDETANGATSWSWTFPGGTPSTSTAQNPSVTYTTAGSYSVKLVASNNLGADSITHTLVVGANPTATSTTTPATSATSATGSATVVAASGSSPYNYSWSNGATTATIANVVAGTYSVTVVDANGCQVVDDTIHVTYTNGIIQLSSGQQVKVYPNPATDVLNLVWSEKSNAEVSVLDLNGNVISTFVTAGDMKSACNVRDLAAGSYILRITDKSSNQQKSMLFSKF